MTRMVSRAGVATVVAVATIAGPVAAHVAAAPPAERNAAAPDRNRVVAARAGSRPAPRMAESTQDFAVTPVVGPRVRTFVASTTDFERSSTTGRVVVPLVLTLLVAWQVLAAAGRSESRALFAYGFPLITCLAMFIGVRLHEYLQ